MRLFLYYVSHSLFNTIKKLMKTWVMILIIAMFVLGIIFGLVFALLDRAIELDLPLLGICRGLQFMNAALGGTLYQDIPSEFGTAISHRNAPPKSHASHDILLEPGTPLSYLLQEKRIAVNSTHHQGIKRLSPILKCMARAFDGLTEAAYLPLKKFIWGVQWHPELPDLYCNDLNEKIFETFVTYARLGRNKY